MLLCLLRYICKWTEASYTVTLGSNDYGALSITSAPVAETYTYGTDIEITVTPDPGYPLTSFSVYANGILLTNGVEGVYYGTSKDIKDFSDCEDVALWALNGAEFCVGAGIMEGSGGKLSPLSEITRAETATIVLRLLEAIV